MIPSLLLLVASLAQTPAPREPASLLNALYDDLRKASRSAPDARDKLRKAAKEAFDRDLTAAVPKAPRSVWELFSDHLERLADADRFPAKTDKAERDLWLLSCRAALNRLLTFSRESKAPDAEMPTTTLTFNEAMDAAGDVRSRFGREGVEDLSGAAFDGLSLTYRSLIRRARAPAGDPKSQYTSQLAKIDQKYPVDGEAHKRSNGRANSLLRDAAKAALDRALSTTR